MLSPEIKNALRRDPALVLYDVLLDILKESKLQTEILKDILKDLPSRHDY